MSPSEICVDASLVVALLLPEPTTAQVRALWRTWIYARSRRIAPPLLFAEVTSVLRNRVATGEISPAEGERAFAQFLRLPIGAVAPPNLHERAWALAKTFNRP